MTRTDIINTLITRHNYTTYLEIGVESGYNFKAIQLDNKIGVDPDPESAATIHTTSDEFFRANTQTFDLIFIDGLHHADQAYQDALNALNVLNEGGTIVMHDCYPTSELMQAVPRQVKVWTGDVWRAWLRLLAKIPDKQMFVINTDYGVGIIMDGTPTPIEKGISDISYAEFAENAPYYLNLVEPDHFMKEWEK